MINTVGFRPQLHPPKGSQLQQNYRPLLTCITVSGCIAVLVCVVFGLTAFNIYSHRFGSVEHHYHAGDEISLTQASGDLSAMFCSAYSMQPMGWMDFYLLPHEARIDQTTTVPMNFTLMALSTCLNQSIHYLTVNSTVRLSACYDTVTSNPVSHHASHVSAEFLVIVGDISFQEWHKHFDSRHVKYTVPIPQNATCGSPTPVATLNLTVPSSDNYHFLLLPAPPSFLRSASRGATLTLTGSMNKTVFDLTGAAHVCNASENSCQFSLQWGSHPDVVAKICQDVQNPDAPVCFFTRCHERLEFWVPVFGGLPVVLIVLTWVSCWCLLMRRQSLHSRYRHRLDSQASHAGYGSCGQTEPLITETSTSGQEQAPHNEEQCASIQS